MLSLWEVKMRVLLYLLLAAVCVSADKNNNKRNKLPFVADAVGNSLPPPSSVPATVGSPVNLLTPDRYEFYTFDESGELVKRLMTLEEIQAIVAAGEEADGLVTLDTDNPPTVSFDNQPPHTKVHSVVTNVQNVLKAQMEAHKNRPQVQPTLDTPDVSNSWSLILPSIFGNTGVDIVLDKASGSVTTPETETIEEQFEDEENSLSKEGNNQVISSSTTVEEEKVAVTEKVTKEEPTTTTTTITSTTTTTMTPRPTTTTRRPTTTTRKLTTTTRKPTTTTPKVTTTTRKTITTTSKPTTTTQIPSTTTKSPSSTTTRRPTVLTTTTKQPTTAKYPTRPSSTADTPSTIVTTKLPATTTTTVKPSTSKPVIKITEKVTTEKPETTSKTQSVSILPNQEPEGIKVQFNSNALSTTNKNDTEYEKISTFIPVSTVNYITERTTHKPVATTKTPIVYASTTKRSVITTTKAPTTEPPKIQTFATTSKPVISTSTYIASTFRDQENDKLNVTTITTQSVSPSTTESSTELVSGNNLGIPEKKPVDVGNNYESEKEGESLLPIFDVAQSISQIASDLGGNYQPIPTTSNLLDTTKVDVLDFESKEVLDMDIPSGAANNTKVKTSETVDKNSDNFVKISTIDPHDRNENKNTSQKEIENTINQTEVKEIKTKVTEIQKNDTNDIVINATEQIQNLTSDSKQHNILINNIQKVEFLTTTVVTEPTTIDPILSESMGDLLSQVVNDAPQSIVNSENNSQEDTKLVTTQNNIEITTEEIANTTFELSNKVKKDTSSTTELSIQPTADTYAVKENNFSLNVNVTTESNSDKNTDFQETKPTETVTTSNVSSIQDKTEESTQNFVQISVSTNNNDTKLESVPLENKDSTNNNDTKLQSVPLENKDTMGASDIKNNETRDGAQPEMTKNGNKTTEADTQNISSIKVTTSLPELDIATTTPIPNKISQSNFNNINLSDKTSLNNKKDKLPELLPKVDDFKKKIQKVNIDEEELINERNNSWKLIPTLSPPKVNEIPKDKVKFENHYIPDNNDNKVIDLEYSKENQGLEVTTRDLEEDVARFSELSNELSFRFWNVMIDDIDKRRSFVLSPYSIFSMLAMIFMGARGATSGEMNEILKLDDMVTFNPHFTLKNISDSIETTPESGVAVSAFIRELYSDRNKGKILTFYKERAQHFYNGHVEEINFKLISDIIRRRTNLLVKRYTWGRIPEYMKTNNIVMQPPLAAFTANIFETDCTGTSVDGRDGEMYFVVSPNVRQRRLVPVPAVVYKSGFLAGYDPGLDATAAALGNTNSIVSTLFLMPGQQGNVVHADDLEKLEQRLLDASPTTPTWNRVLRTLLPRTGLELQIPRFSHKSTFNVSMSLRKMGLKDLFDGDHADLGGLNGPSKDLYLSDMVQLNTFTTCGEDGVGDQHHVEEYPETLSVSQRRRARWLNNWDEPRDYQRAFHDPHDVGDAMHLPLHLRPRQARLPARSALPARLKFDRPFLYFVRHNPSGMILYFGRYNPRLLP